MRLMPNSILQKSVLSIDTISFGLLILNFMGFFCLLVIDFITYKVIDFFMHLNYLDAISWVP